MISAEMSLSYARIPYIWSLLLETSKASGDAEKCFHHLMDSFARRKLTDIVNKSYYSNPNQLLFYNLRFCLYDAIWK